MALSSNNPLRSLPKWPYCAPDEVAAVVRVLESGKINYWTGEEGRQFEQEFAAFVGCKYGVALASGTAALELALIAGTTHDQKRKAAPGVDAFVADQEEAGEVIVPARTFIASASCAVMKGLKPVIADVDRDSQNITAETIRAVLTPRTKAIIAVHLAGWPCDMDAILDVAREHRLLVIEDCAQAHGAAYKERSVGSMGHIAAFSFCQDKIMTTGGEGGMLVTNDREIWKKAWAYKDHGKSYDAVHNQYTAVGFRWLHESFGTNLRLTEMQSALGRAQLRKLPEWVKRRQRNAAILTTQFQNLPGLRLVLPPSEIGHSYYKYYAFIRPDLLKPKWDRARIVTEINARGIPCFSGSCGEIYLEKAFVPEMQPENRLPVAKELGETSLMFPVHPTLTEEDMGWIAKVASDVIRSATEM